MRPRIFAALLSAALLLPAPAGAQELLRYNSAGNPKAKGLNLSVKYPSGWRAQDGERPNIVQKFVKTENGVSEILMLQVNRIPSENTKNVQALTEQDYREVFANMGENTTVHSIRRTKLENQTAYVGDITSTVERAGASVHQSASLMILIYKDRMIFLTCGTGGSPQKKALIDTKQQTNRPGVCQQFFNSLVILDQYK